MIYYAVFFFTNIKSIAFAIDETCGPLTHHFNMFIFLLTSLSLSFYTLANPISQNLDAIVVADNSLNAEGVKNSNNLNFPQNTLVAGPNLVELPSIDCTSDASTNEISDESTSTSEFNRRSASSCPVNYGSMPDAITQTREEHAGERKPSEPSKNPCSDYPKTKLFTCGGPIIGHPEFPWAGAADPFDDKILNCFQGKFFQKNLCFFSSSQMSIDL